MNVNGTLRTTSWACVANGNVACLAGASRLAEGNTRLKLLTERAELLRNGRGVEKPLAHGLHLAVSIAAV